MSLGVALILYALFFVVKSTLTWKSPMFSSTDYEGVFKKAIDSQNPKECDKLADNFGDFEPKANCYSESLFEIGDPSLCDRFNGGPFCKRKIAVKRSDISLCNTSDLNSYNACIYEVAAGNKRSDICDSLKEGTNYSRDKCLLEIVGMNMRSIPEDFSVKDARSICMTIEGIQSRDYCIGIS